jgi:thioredoxin 1
MLLFHSFGVVFIFLTFEIRCPPCKAIAPLFADFASKNTIPKGVAFAKVDVDSQSVIAQEFKITAMPTFMLLKNGEVLKTVRGANPAGLKTLVMHAIQTVKKQKKESGEDVSADEEVDDANGDLDSIKDASGMSER